MEVGTARCGSWVFTFVNIYFMAGDLAYFTSFRSPDEPERQDTIRSILQMNKLASGHFQQRNTRNSGARMQT